MPTIYRRESSPRSSYRSKVVVQSVLYHYSSQAAPRMLPLAIYLSLITLFPPGIWSHMVLGFTRSTSIMKSGDILVNVL